MGLSQIPQLSSSRPMDMKQPFHIVPEGSTGTRRAVMIGINYRGQEGELSGCQNDVKNVRAIRYVASSFLALLFVCLLLTAMLFLSFSASFNE